MRKNSLKLLAAIVLALLACFFSISYFIPWSGQHNKVVHLEDGTEVNVDYRWKDKVDLDLFHLDVINLFRGKTLVALTLPDGTEHQFSIREDLKLFAAHQITGNWYFIFVPDYMPQRGFISYMKAPQDTLFREISVKELPIHASIPSFEPFLEEVQLLEKGGTEPPKEFYRTYTSWLWSQMATGRDHIGYNADVAAVRDAWQRAKGATTLR